MKKETLLNQVTQRDNLIRTTTIYLVIIEYLANCSHGQQRKININK